MKPHTHFWSPRPIGIVKFLFTFNKNILIRDSFMEARPRFSGNQQNKNRQHKISGGKFIPRKKPLIIRKENERLTMELLLFG